MQLVERHIIKKSHPDWVALDEAAFRAKNLWNAANYVMRQTFFEAGVRLSLGDLYKAVREHYPQDYEALPGKVANQVLIQVIHAWAAWVEASATYNRDPSAFTGRPKLPKYKHKTAGRCMVVYEKGAISKRQLMRGLVTPSRLGIAIPTQQTVETVRQVWVVPRTSCYVVEVVYEAQAANPIESPYIAGIDLGIDNLAAVTSDKPGLRPFLVNGRPLKSINHYYNKRKAELQSRLAPDRHSSHRIERLAHRRNCKVDDYLHKASRMMIDWCLVHQSGTLVIGKNPGWKQAVRLGKQTNQNFVSIPHARFIHMLTYKAQLAGVQVVVTEESYSSKCSFLDLEPVGKHKQYCGRRIKRGLFRSGTGRLINADINAAFNIIRKAVPNAFADGIEGVAVRPLLSIVDY
jgi:putative transposase